MLNKGGGLLKAKLIFTCDTLLGDFCHSSTMQETARGEHSIDKILAMS